MFDTPNKDLQLLKIILLFSLFCFTAHAHELDYSSEDVQKIYDNIQTTFERNDFSKQYITIKDRRGRTFKITEGKLTALVREGLLLNLDLILRNCTINKACEVKEVKDKFHKNLPHMIKTTVSKIKNGALWTAEFVMDLMYDAVTGVRRYGVLYFILVGTGEAIEHFVLHPLGILVPLCKAVQVGTIKILDGVKNTTLTLFSKFPVSITMKDRLSILAQTHAYKKYLTRHINRYLAYSANPDSMNDSRFKSIKSYFKKINLFDDMNEKFYLHSFENNSSPVEKLPKKFKSLKLEEKYLKMFAIERDIHTLNFLVEVNESLVKALHEEGKLSVKDYVRAKWRLGELGGFIDKYQVLVRGLSLSQGIEAFSKEAELIKLELVRSLREFSKNPLSEKSKLQSKALKKVMKLFDLKKCYDLYIPHTM